MVAMCCSLCCLKSVPQQGLLGQICLSLSDTETDMLSLIFHQY